MNWTTVNCPRGGDKKQCQIPTWGVETPGGVGTSGGWGMKLTSSYNDEERSVQRLLYFISKLANFLALGYVSTFILEHI